ncbi:hypothetical protein F5Y17DRAFT_450266 [Xylariaceae sp. FL0594]|nr:hypothetical protein F5Y17DRAFT_450266 [Xylariaceae sp. FL0594]
MRHLLFLTLLALYALAAPAEARGSDSDDDDDGDDYDEPGFEIPEGQADGVYLVSYDAAGLPSFEFLGSLTSDVLFSAIPLDANSEAADLLPDEKADLASISSSSSGNVTITKHKHRHKRPFDKRMCGGEYLDHYTDMAVEALKKQCDPAGSIDGHQSFYSIHGSTLAYMCNRRHHHSVACWRDLLTESYTAITEECGAYRSGWRDVRGYKYRHIIGYDRTGHRYCGGKNSTLRYILGFEQKSNRCTQNPRSQMTRSTIYLAREEQGGWMDGWILDVIRRGDPQPKK